MQVSQGWQESLAVGLSDTYLRRQLPRLPLILELHPK